MDMLTTQNIKQLVLLLAVYCSSQVAYAQVGIVAGQTSGMQLRYPANATFHCIYQTSLQCNTLDADSDGTDDFSLFCDAGGIYTLGMGSLQPAIWEILQYDTSTNGYTMPVQLASPIGPASGTSTWAASTGTMLNSGPIGQSQNATVRGNWRADTLTRIIGIRKLQNGQWRYGYLKTKYPTPNWSSYLQVTMCALQNVVTNTKAPQLPQVELYPNPTQLLLQIKSPQAAKLRIYNALGSLQYEKMLATGVTPVLVAHWSSGIYIVRLENEDGVYTSRFQKTE